MSTSSLIKKHIFRLPLGRLFTTRELVRYGSRTAVDQAIWKLVNNDVIVRLARGVFVRAGSDLRSITVTEIARVKAESFCRRFSILGRIDFKESGSASESDRAYFGVSGSTSSFKCGQLVVVLKRICARKFALCSSSIGQFLYALWSIGNGHAGAYLFKADILSWLGRKQRQEIRMSLHLVPGWLASGFLQWHLPVEDFRS